MERKVGEMIVFKYRGEIDPDAKITFGKITSVNHFDDGRLFYYTHGLMVDHIFVDYVLESEVICSLSPDTAQLPTDQLSDLLSSLQVFVEHLNKLRKERDEENDEPGRKCDGTCDTCRCEIWEPAT